MFLEEKSREELIQELKKAREEITRMRWSLGTRELQSTSSVFPGMVSERRYRGLFENSPVPIWEEDFSQVKNYLEDLRMRGVRDFRKFFTENNNEVIKCISLIKVLDVNEATVTLYKSGSKRAFFKGLDQILPDESLDVMREEFIALAEGKTTFEAEILQRLFTGEKIDALLRLAIAPGHEYDWSRTLVTIVDISERKRAERDVRKSRERFELAAKGANDGLWDWDLITDEVYFSPRWKDMIGYRDEEFPNTFAAFEKTIHPADRDRVITMIKNYLEGKQPIFETEFRFRHKKGPYRWILARAAAIWNEQGKAIRMAGSHMDITERVETQVQLERRARELETVTEVSNAVSTILEPDAMLQRVVDLTKERFGLYHAHIYLLDETGEILVLKAGAGEIGKQMVAEYRTIPMSTVRSVVALAANTREGVKVNNVKLTTHYLPHPLLPNTQSEVAVPLVAGNTLIGVLDVQADQTDYFTDEDVQIQSILASQVAIAIQNSRQYSHTQQSEQLVRIVIDSTPDWIFIKDLEHRYRLVNKSYADCWRLSPEEFVGKQDGGLELLGGEEGAGKAIMDLGGDDQAVINSGEPITNLRNMVVVNGETRILNTFKTPLWDANGSVMGVLAFCRDVTEQENFQDSLRRLAEIQTLLSQATDEEEIIYAVMLAVEDPTQYTVALNYFETDEEGQPSVLHTVSTGGGGSAEVDIPGKRMALEGYPLAELWKGTTEAILIEDVLQDSRSNEALKIIAQEMGFRSVAILPLRGLGVLNFVWQEVYPFTSEEKFVLRSLVDAVSAVVATRQAVLKTEKALAETELLYGVSRDLSAASSLEEIFEVVQEPFMETGASEVELFLVRSEDEAGQPREFELTANRQRINESMVYPVGTVFEMKDFPIFQLSLAGRQEPLYINDVQHHPHLDEQTRQILLQNEVKALSIFPLVANQKVLGVILVNWDRPFEIPSDIRRVVLALVEQAGVVLNNQQLVEQVQKRAAELATVAEVSTSVSTILEPERMLQSVVNLAKERFNLYHAHIYLLDEAGQMLVLTCGAGEVGQQMVAEQRVIALAAQKSLVARAARLRESVIVNQVQDDPDFLPHPLLPDTASEMAVPMVVGGRVTGVLDVQSDMAGAFSEEESIIFATFAAQVAVALQNARLYAQTQREAEQESLINTISEHIQATTTVEAALKVAVRELGRALGASQTTVQLRLPDANNEQF